MTPTQRLLRNATDSLSDTQLTDRYGIARPFASVERRRADDYRPQLPDLKIGVWRDFEMVPVPVMEAEVMRWKAAAVISSSLLACALVGSWAWWLL